MEVEIVQPCLQFFRLHLARYSSRNPQIRKTTSQNEQQATGKPLFHWRNDDFKRGEETSGCLCSSGLLYTKQSSCSRLHLHFKRKTENSMGLQTWVKVQIMMQFLSNFNIEGDKKHDRSHQINIFIRKCC